MYIFIHFKVRNINHWGYRIWGYLVYIFCFTPLKIERRFKTKKGQSYVYCANHTSYADIPTLYCSIFQDISFIGKSSLGKVPLFGYIYSRIHILVDRRSRNSKLETIVRSKEALDNGSSLIIFPEGTIPKAGNNPNMIDFKDGAFKIAIEKGVPVVPVTIPYNYLILPDDHKLSAQLHICKVIFHEPIETTDMTLKDVSALKQRVFDIISSELNKHI
jgi:1-acyl-sn-glycerol-3-phosphate acyltransferase